jgi:parallel beta-helix repeat protein
MRSACSVLLLSGVLHASTLTVKSGGGGNYTTIQACATAMVAGDTCTVFAGTYAENVTVTAGTVGNYKTINVNGSDVVTVQAFVLNSHTKIIGNCRVPAAINTCGFNIQNTASPSATQCVGIPNGATDIYIVNNVMYACGNSGNGVDMIGVSSAAFSVSFIYVQGNTLSYACITQSQAGTATKECNGIFLPGANILIENNDLSHYTLGIYFSNASNSVYRGNTIHDQYETEAGGNAHTDAFYSSPSATTDHNLIENNLQYNGVGVNAKGLLTQGEFSPCNGACAHVVIFRFNTIHDIGSGNLSGYGYNSVKLYNNTYVNLADLCSGCFGGIDNFLTDLTFSMVNGSDINNLFYFPGTITSADAANPTAFDSASAATGTWGHSLAYCNATGASNCALYGHIYEAGTWTADSGNILGYQDHSPTNNPKFANLAGNDFHLQAGSPALNAGTFLTTVAAGDSGSGTSLVVNDAAFFQDGYGLTNANSTVSADCISVTTVANHICITAVNYSTNTLTMASGFSRSSGDSVWLYSDSSGTVQLVGSAPNIGAKMQAPATSGSGLSSNTSLVGPGTVR